MAIRCLGVGLYVLRSELRTTKTCKKGVSVASFSTSISAQFKGYFCSF